MFVYVCCTAEAMKTTYCASSHSIFNISLNILLISTKLNKVVLHWKSFGYDCKGCSFVTCLLDNIDLV